MQYVAVGSKVRITYNGKTRNKRNQEVNLFRVEIAELFREAAEPSSLEASKPILNTET